MKFKANSRRRALEYEKDWVQRWKEQGTFEKSVEQRSVDDSYVFYDGPPFITGVPHHGTLLSSVVKDAVPRYQTMKGKRVERVWGWDCHGLPAEVFTEKKLGIKDRRDIGTKISLEQYITTARDNMVQTSSLWNDTIDRIGRWVDMDNAYKTMDKDYMESIWWAFKTLYDKKKIYEGERVLMYCTRDATPLSKAEVTMDAGAYQDVTDPSVYVKFKLSDGGTLLAWTTTPWTLPANTAVAVNKDLDYAEVKVGDEQFILAKELIQKVLTDEKHKPLDYQVVRELKGSELVGLSYKPLFEDRGEGAHKVWAADYVSAEDGSGIVHIAPAYGEEDFELAQKQGIPVVHVIDENGLYSQTEWKGENVWEINKTIAKSLHERGMVWKIDYIRHPYPHCHRCGTRLMYRAHPSWFFDVQGQKQLMLEKNTQQIEWFPEHLKHGRWEKNIEAAPDWNLSRDRFWATAMPVWEGKDKDGKKHQIVVGSYAELKELSGQELDDYHRPWVDDIEFDKDGVHYKRIEKVLDGWFESGSMPFAQFHYPFENKEKFEANFPGDFISEYIGQVRAWFYYLHVVGVGLFGEAPFKNVITTGVVAGNDGRKMSKSYGNYTDPNELMDKFSADSLRFLLLSSPLLSGEDFALHDKDVGDIARKLSMIWNMYDFFTMYAEVDGWEFDSTKPFTLNPEDVANPLDKWVISRVHELNKHVTEHMDAYNLPVAMSEFLPFIEDASNWFVRRSRRRFWKSEDDGDKAEAYRTLHYVLMKLSVILAPFTPFLSEELYQNLGGGNESVHLLDWPTNYSVDQAILDEMRRVREYVNQALSIRAKERVKIRQPLASVTVPKLGEVVDFEDILKEELNVKQVIEPGIRERMTKRIDVELDLVITPELKREGLMREVIRHIQAARKEAGLNVDDRIELFLDTDDEELTAAIHEHTSTIQAETLADTLSQEEFDYKKEVKVEDTTLVVSLQKHLA
jgi:isoleucyl-tRNA synthetase